MLNSRLSPNKKTQIHRSTRLIMFEVEFLRDGPWLGVAGDALLILAQCHLASPQRNQNFDFTCSSADFLFDHPCLFEQPNRLVILL